MTRASLWALVFLAGCALPGTPRLEEIVLRSTDGAPRPLAAELAAHDLTVVTFFSAHCPCQAAHDERLRALIATAASRGAGVLVVDSEESATAASDAEEAKLRGYPIVLDDGGKLARVLGAEYATYSVVLRRDGTVLYRGGFDSQKSHLGPGATPYLANALDDLAAGRAVRETETKALGCSLTLY